MHLGACLVPFKRHRPWQQRELSAYLTVKACEKEERRRREGGGGNEPALEKFRCKSSVKLGLCVLFFNRRFVFARWDTGELAQLAQLGKELRTQTHTYAQSLSSSGSHERQKEPTQHKVIPALSPLKLFVHISVFTDIFTVGLWFVHHL